MCEALGSIPAPKKKRQKKKKERKTQEASWERKREFCCEKESFRTARFM
jgi:hypothetical protein